MSLFLEMEKDELCHSLSSPPLDTVREQGKKLWLFFLCFPVSAVPSQCSHWRSNSSASGVTGYYVVLKVDTARI